jgi:uncharacterized protein YqeY
MSLSDRINSAMKEAMKAGRKLELETLRTIRAGILDIEKKKVGTVLTEEDELAVLTAAAKKRREAIEQYRNAGREELAAQEQGELEIIMQYLPQPLTEAEIEALVKETIERTGAVDMKDLGKVMGPVVKATKGKADGSAIQAVVRRLLGGA